MCKICGKDIIKINSLEKHLRISHNYNLIEYLIKYNDFKIPICKFCDNVCKRRSGILYSTTCCSEECKKKCFKRKLSDETKRKLSNIRKEWLRNNPEKHPWKNNNKFKSVPCETLKNKLKDRNMLFQEEIRPLENRFYSIDIAFIDKGIGLEVNGNQHYDNTELKPYYKNRKNEIEKNGWRLYDIHYTKVYDDDFVNDLIRMINGESIILDLKFKINIEKPIYKCKCGNILKSNKTGDCVKCSRFKKRKVERPSYDQLINNIKSLGYLGTGRKYGVSDNCIRKWIKYYEKQ